MAKDTTKQSKVTYISTVGRRREAVARVRLYANPPTNIFWEDKILKKGDIYVNNLPIEEYFSGPVSKNKFLLPLRLTNTIDKYVITVKVMGGGSSGQLDAMVHGIARALDKTGNEDFHSLLKKHNLLTRDARARERRKVGMGGKARRKKQSPKR